MMTKPEISRRLSGLSAEVLAKAYRDLMAGNGAATLVIEHPISLKQANALFAWCERYGAICPQPSNFAEAVQS
jgi:hypothetical protein